MPTVRRNNTGNQREKKMSCLECGNKLVRTLVSIDGAKGKAVSYQCRNCDYVMFEKSSAEKVLDELRSPLAIEQKVIKSSHNRLGIYLSKDVSRSLNLKGGEKMLISVPDNAHIILTFA